MYRLFLFDKISTCVTDLHSVYLSDYQLYINLGSYIPPDPKPGGYNLCL